MPDFEKSDRLWKEACQLTDAQVVVLFLDYVAQELYGDKGFNEAIEQGLSKMKAAPEVKK